MFWIAAIEHPQAEFCMAQALIETVPYTSWLYATLASLGPDCETCSPYELWMLLEDAEPCKVCINNEIVDRSPVLSCRGCPANIGKVSVAVSKGPFSLLPCDICSPLLCDTALLILFAVDNVSSLNACNITKPVHVMHHQMTQNRQSRYVWQVCILHKPISRPSQLDIYEFSALEYSDLWSKKLLTYAFHFSTGEQISVAT